MNFFQSDRDKKETKKGSLDRLASTLPRDLWYVVVHLQNKADRIVNFVEQLPGY
jgi:hypothetical protein